MGYGVGVFSLVRHHPEHVERLIDLVHVERAAAVGVEESKRLRRVGHLVRVRVRVEGWG